MIQKGEFIVKRQGVAAGLYRVQAPGLDAVGKPAVLTSSPSPRPWSHISASLATSASFSLRVYVSVCTSVLLSL